MDWYRTLLELVDMRSFSSVWFWIVLAAVWAMAGGRVLGVPYDMILAARREGGQANQDLEDLVRINVIRRLSFAEKSGLLVLGAGCFALSALLILGWGYGFEFSQALFLLFLPLSISSGVTHATARQIWSQEPQGEPLYRCLLRLRAWVQAIGMAAIFTTALWGMYRYITVGALGL